MSCVPFLSLDAYGNAEGFDPTVALTGMLYRSEHFQATIGRNFQRARWYDPQTGTWNRIDDFFGNPYGQKTHPKSKSSQAGASQRGMVMELPGN